jgi:hypothetical protein
MITAKHIKAIEELIDYCYASVPYFGDPPGTATPDELDDPDVVDTEKLGKRACKALAALKALDKRTDGSVMVQIGLEGGIVQGATANVPMHVVVFDYDTGMGDEERLSSVPQGGGSPNTQAFVTTHQAHMDPRFIKRVKKFLTEDQ